MRNLKRILLGVFLLLMVLVVLAFVLENQQSVSLLFFGFSGPQLPVSVVAVLALLVGMLIGPVLGWFLGRASRAARKGLV
ncbi:MULTISPECIES: LapA family protein [Pseudomonas]|uniref:Lipopolysaccharide assembly protein LapA domain-containing protein n=1 Tax=Pseudomonas siliginis TaxID=2842346 RepID=A0ABY5CCE4_9PSED|nr:MULTISPECIES: LapA family protein [Pseudomonas]MEB2651349.1 LapA family protein [Pseudomonas siliginis]UST72984.1 lipopolysaccharide assembly protein LapA domain-containing protein [Pseudomonas siliginis]UST83571.1 lipopolysaccharide assembly protein LapA domain-containing protein [Pseudomonas siliginis]UST88766.1 lipopolysaccharide assembly protein LapA domain-containing protein [Pseudomonas siliginis]UVL93006.1 lipopolysaccharide assembly protein LapA domain-containing protein [Pseudomona